VDLLCILLRNQRHKRIPGLHARRSCGCRRSCRFCRSRRTSDPRYSNDVDQQPDVPRFSWLFAARQRSTTSTQGTTLGFRRVSAVRTKSIRDVLTEYHSVGMAMVDRIARLLVILHRTGRLGLSRVLRIMTLYISDNLSPSKLPRYITSSAVIVHHADGALHGDDGRASDERTSLRRRLPIS